jgi:hypothetical protein
MRIDVHNFMYIDTHPNCCSLYTAIANIGTLPFGTQLLLFDTYCSVMVSAPLQSASR